MLLHGFSHKEKILFALYSIVFFALFLYSFTQVDLGLSFAKSESLRTILSSFQHIGYFDRLVSTQLYIGIVIALTFLYCMLLTWTHRKQLSKKFVWSLIVLGTIALTFSYNAFSYDLFNYIFDAKIVTYYQSNPYLHKALDYPADPMLAFMHWTHRVYPYGPIWLLITVPLSFIGLHIFLLTFLLFKLLTAFSFLGTVWMIGKIMQKINPQKETFALVFFGLNPLILIESLVSAHIDIVMMFFAVGSLFLLITNNYLKGYILLAVSIGVKFVTGVLLPIFVAIHLLERKKKKYSLEKLVLVMLGLLLIGVVLQAYQSGNFQPWYLLAPLSFATLFSYRYWILIPSVVLSIGALGLYIPYLFLGNFDPPVPAILQTTIITMCSLAFCFTVLYFFSKQFMVLKTKQSKK